MQRATQGRTPAAWKVEATEAQRAGGSLANRAETAPEASGSPRHRRSHALILSCCASLDAEGVVSL